MTGSESTHLRVRSTFSKAVRKVRHWLASPFWWVGNQINGHCKRDDTVRQAWEITNYFMATEAEADAVMEQVGDILHDMPGGCLLVMGFGPKPSTQTLNWTNNGANTVTSSLTFTSTLKKIEDEEEDGDA